MAKRSNFQNAKNGMIPSGLGGVRGGLIESERSDSNPPPARLTFHRRTAKYCENRSMGAWFQLGSAIGPIGRPPVAHSLHKKPERSEADRRAMQNGGTPAAAEEARCDVRGTSAEPRASGAANAAREHPPANGVESRARRRERSERAGRARSARRRAKRARIVFPEGADSPRIFCPECADSPRIFCRERVDSPRIFCPEHADFPRIFCRERVDSPRIFCPEHADSPRIFWCVGGAGTLNVPHGPFFVLKRRFHRRFLGAGAALIRRPAVFFSPPRGPDFFPARIFGLGAPGRGPEFFRGRAVSGLR